jgi:transcription elongation GreA/GreB family factor
MSRAFVKEPDGDNAFEELPERQIPEHPNLVTAEGLVLIEAEIARLEQAYASAQASGQRAALNVVARDLRYWSARRGSADVMPPPPDTATVHFGSRVRLKRDDGREQTYRIVGEDEADPAKGSVSYVAPLARALIGKSVGVTVRMGAGEAEVVGIE